MGDLLRMVQEHPNAEIVGICDEQESRMQASADNFGIPTEHIFTDHGACLEKTQPDFVILCPATAEHGDWTEKVAPYGVNILVEKPFAASLAEADRMIAIRTDCKTLGSIRQSTASRGNLVLGPIAGD